MGNPIKTAQDCWSTCCGQRDCTTWNWCSGGGCAADGGGCWLGSSAASTCQPNAAWVGGTGRGVPPPPPPPPPALPGAPQNLTLPLTGLSPQPLPYKLGPNVDSESFFFKLPPSFNFSQTEEEFSHVKPSLLYPSACWTLTDCFPGCCSVLRLSFVVLWCTPTLRCRQYLFGRFSWLPSQRYADSYASPASSLA